MLGRGWRGCKDKADSLSSFDSPHSMSTSVSLAAVLSPFARPSFSPLPRAVAQWEALRQHAVKIFLTLPLATDQHKRERLAHIDLHAAQVRRATDLNTVRTALQQRQLALTVSISLDCENG